MDGGLVAAVCVALVIGLLCIAVLLGDAAGPVFLFAFRTSLVLVLLCAVMFALDWISRVNALLKNQ